MLSPNALDARLGAAKVLLELSDALNQSGHARCDVVGPEEVGATRTLTPDGWTGFADRQRQYLVKRAGDYDVVDYDHESLPYSRSVFDPRPLFVARSVLLAHHLETRFVPGPRSPRAALGRLIHGRARAEFNHLRVASATTTCREADLVNVSNEDDRTELLARSIDRHKIAVLPYGLTTSRREALRRQPRNLSTPPVVAFVGTFDYRKGALDFPGIFKALRRSVPGVRLSLLGTAGLFSTAADVLSFFRVEDRASIHVTPTFHPDALPSLLADCSVGVFPSYYEGFGFGVLEMLAASIPVVAYDAPGPPMMLERQCLVPPGDVEGMAQKVADLLANTSLLSAAQAAAERAAATFDWAQIARDTLTRYRGQLDARAGTDSQRATG